MPKKYAKKFAKKKRTFRKRGIKRGTKQYTTINKSLSVISPRYITKLHYNSAENTLASVSGSLADHVFSLNSLFDPDVTSTGHQPMGFDQLAGLYNRYRVFATSWRITYITNGSTFSLVVLPNNSNSSLGGASLSTTQEQSRAISKCNTITTPTYYNGHINLPRLNGVTSAQYKADDRFQSLTSTSPVEQLSLHVMAAATASSTQTMRFNIKITYHVEFYDPLDISAS